MAAEPDDVDLKLAIAVALGLPVEDAVEAAGLASRSSYYTRAERNLEFYERVRLIVEPLAERTIAVQVGALKAAQSAEDKISRRLDDALKITDRLLKHLTEDDNAGRCDECGRISATTIDQLFEGQKHLVKWAAEYAASKAPTRVAHEGSVLHAHVVVRDDLADALMGFQAHMLTVPALLQPAIDAKGINAER